MSEDVPENLLKADNEEESVLTDATEASNLSDENDMSVAMDLPKVTDMPVTDTQAAVSEDIPMEEGMEMVEERLHDSLESQENQGQEEWLSEDVLTDDDFNSAAETADSQTSQPDNSLSEPSPTTLISNETAEPQTEPVQTDPVNIDPISKDTVTEVPEQNIEDALNTLQGGPEKEAELPDLDAFLIKKTNQKPEKCEAKTETKEQDDGNDTDDLLRMLGEDGIKTKKLTKTVKDVRSSVKNEAASSDDDDFVFEGASAKKFKLVKTLSKKLPSKAESKGMEEDRTEQSSDEVDTIKKMFNSKKSNSSKTQEAKARYPGNSGSHPKSIASVEERPKKDRLATSTPLRASRVRSLLKTTRASAAGLRAPLQNIVEVKKEANPITYSRSKQQSALKTPLKTSTILKAPIKVETKLELEENNEEFLEEDNFHLPEEEYDSDVDDEMGNTHQRIMKPEKMDEDMPSDLESHSEDGSLYDELPSSESEDANDWFQLDIRAEKAGDYLPLLGSKAKEMLLEEKQRVSARLANLKQSLSALTESGKKQAEQVRTATMALAELDDMLKAS